jgi:hypothetical protein
MTKCLKIIIMDRCFWEELPTGISIYKNNELIEYLSNTPAHSTIIEGIGYNSSY